MNGDLAWVELPGGRDCRATGAFYARVFGWLVDDEDGMVRFRDPSGSLAGAFVGELPAASGGPILYLATDDAAAALEAAAAVGGGIELGRTEIAPGVGYRALVRDPAGSVIGLFELAPR